MAITFNHNDQVYVKDGKLGIGTDNPSRSLHVSAGNTDIAAKFENTSINSTVLHLQTTGDGKSMYFQTDHIYVSSGAMHFGNDTGDLYLKPGSSSGVGINTTNPTGLFNSYISAARQITHNGNGGDLSVISDNNSSPVFYVKGTGTADLVNVFDNTTEVFTIKDGGNVGIGTTSPSSILDIQNVPSGGSGTILNIGLDASNPVRAKIHTESYNGAFSLYDSGSNEDVKITTSGNSYFNGGNVGIGTTSPSYKLDVEGDVGINDYIQHNGDNSRIGFPSNDVIALVTSNAERMRIDSSGNVGIGTTSPGRQLELRGQGVIRLNATSGGDPGLDFNTSDVNDMQIRYRSTTDALAIYSYGTSSDVLTIRKSDGNVGIGTTSPANKLTVNDTLTDGLKYPVQVANITSGDGAGTSAGILFNVGYGGTSRGKGALVYNSNGTGYNKGDFMFLQNSVADTSQPVLTDAVVTIKNNGNVGIGTTSPNTKLHVNVASTADYVINANDRLKVKGDGTLWWGSAADYGNLTWDTGKAIVKGQSGLALSLGANNSQDHLYINTSGNVGIGTTSPSHKLTVYTDATSGLELVGQNGGNQNSHSSKIIFNGHAQNNGPFIQAINTSAYGIKRLGFFANRTATDYTTLPAESMSITNTGNVGINTTNPSYKLEVNGKIATPAGAIVIEGQEIYANSEYSGNDGSVRINRFGYLGGQTRFRDTVIYNGKGSQIMTIDGSTSYVGIGTTNPSVPLTVAANSGGNAIRLLGRASDGYAFTTFRNNADSATNGEIGISDAQNMLFYTGTSERMRIDSSGKVGIGTTSPGYKLHVDDNTAYGGVLIEGDNAPGLSIRDNSGTSLSKIYVQSTASSQGNLRISSDDNNTATTPTIEFIIGGSHKMRVLDNGNVGIGTTSPNTFLHIAGQGNRSGGQIYLGNQDDGSVKYSLITSAHYNAATEPEGFTLITGLSTATENTVSIGGFVYESNPATDIRFFTHTATTHTTGGSERMRITSSGNVGIGTTSPGSTLEVDGSFNVVNGNNSITHFNYVDGSTNYVRGITYFDNASAYFTGGNVGIGTTSPSHKLHVEGFIATNDSSNASGLLIRKAGSTIGFVGQSGGWVGDTTDDLALSGETGKNIRFYTNGSITERMRITSTGNVGIGTDSPAYKLHVVGAIKGTDGFLSSVGTYTGGGTYTNQWQKVATFPYSAFSFSGFKLQVDIIGDTGNLNTNAEVYINWKFQNNDGRIYANIINYGETTLDADNFEIFRDGTNSIITLYHKVTRNYSQPNYTIIGTAAPTWYHSVVGASLTGETDDAFTGKDIVNSLTSRMKAGNIGIGTTSPAYKLHVEDGDIGVGDQYAFKARYSTNENYHSSLRWAGLQLGNNGANRIIAGRTGVGGYLEFWVNNTNDASVYSTTPDGNFAMKIDSSGNVGIGSTAPAAKLNVASTGANAYSSTITKGTNMKGIINALSNNADDMVGIYFGTGTTSEGTHWSGITGSRSQSATDWSTQLNFYTHNEDVANINDATQKMVIKGNGNVGIGTTSPAQKLDVNGDIALKGTSVFNLNSAALTIGDTAGTDSVTTLKLTTAGDSTTVYLDDDGNVGINTATPSYNLTVDSGTNDIGILTASSDSGSYVGFLDNSTSTIPKIGAVGNKLILDASQYVGVRRTDPSYALDVSGTIRATGDVIAYSDARVKENVETIPNALDKVKAMRGVGYNKIGEEKRSIGVIAQEMLDVIPEVVHTDDQGMHSVAYGNLVGVLIEAMKEQQQQIDELKAKIDGSTK